MCLFVMSWTLAGYQAARAVRPYNSIIDFVVQQRLLSIRKFAIYKSNVFVEIPAFDCVTAFKRFDNTDGYEIGRTESL